MSTPGARRILAALTREGTRVRFVGGCVRNALIGAAVGDLDAATPDDPETVTRLLSDGGLKAIPTGIDHGTVTAVSGETVIEITTLRCDVATDGRRAEVAYTADWAADAHRRDFTVNAIYADLDGTLYDPVGGISDLLTGRIRFIGDARVRIQEDYLRILRFFRFHAWYGKGELDADGLVAIAAEVKGLSRLSGERVQKELLRLLAAPVAPGHLLETLEAMRRTGALNEVLPEVSGFTRLEGLMRLEASVLDGAVDALLRFGALVIAPGLSVDRLADRLRLSNRARGRLAAMVETEEAITPRLTIKMSRQKLFRIGPEAFSDRLMLSASMAPDIGHGKLKTLLALAADWVAPTLPVSGKDAIAAGFAIGPAVGRALAEVEAYWAERDFRPRRAELLRRLQDIASINQSGDARG